MGTGKSTIARQLSNHLRFDCLDTDKLVEARAGKPVREVFSELGESHFRDIETEILGECLARKLPAVIAGAGGIVVRDENRLMINRARESQSVVVAWLHASPEVLVDRTAKGSHRPLLDQDRAGTLRRLSEERAPFYSEVADIVVDVSDRSVESTVSLLVDAIEQSLVEMSENDE